MARSFISRALLIRILAAAAAGACLPFKMGQACAPTSPPPPTPTPWEPGQYVGAQATESETQGWQRCHSGHYNDWIGTHHATALETLKAIGQGTNPACIGCHTVGFGESGGYIDEATTPHLAGIQCENCHGPGRDHVTNVDDVNLRPPTDISSAVCGKCHKEVHHPTFEEWSSSGHAEVREHPADSFAEGSSLSSCGVCHSGDYRKAAFIEGQASVPEDLLLGKAREEMNAVTCVICHDPHKQTGNTASVNGEGEDYQLRYPEVASPVQSNKIADATNAARYNLCGQCHHSRGRVWTSTSRGTHHSVQANMYLGEMPLPDEDQTLLVPNTNTAHRFVPEQCVTCHMVAAEFVDELEPADSGHKFSVNMDGCSAVGCHPTPATAEADTQALQAKVEADLASFRSRLGDVSTWEYTSDGGPSDQSNISDEIKKIRFLIHWVETDGSRGVHNPEYTRTILTSIDTRLTALGK